jgi:hypothetical protein
MPFLAPIAKSKRSVVARSAPIDDRARSSSTSARSRAQRPDSVAGVVGLELGNVALIEYRLKPLVCQNIFVPETFRQF